MLPKMSTGQYLDSFGALRALGYHLAVNRSTALRLIALALAAFGIYRAVYVPGMLMGPPVPLLAIGFLLQAVFGVAAGVGVWRGARWAPLAIGLLAASIVATAGIEVILGILAYLRALLDAVVAVLGAIVLGRYVSGRTDTSAAGDPG